MAFGLREQSANLLYGGLTLSQARDDVAFRSVGDRLTLGHPAAGDECQADHARDNGTRHGLKPITLGPERKLPARRCPRVGFLVQHAVRFGGPSCARVDASEARDERAGVGRFSLPRGALRSPRYGAANSLLSMPAPWGAQSRKGANTRVPSLLGEGWEDRRDGLLLPLPRVQGCAWCTRSQSPRLGREGHRVAGIAARTRGSAPPGRAAEGRSC